MEFDFCLIKSALIYGNEPKAVIVVVKVSERNALKLKNSGSCLVSVHVVESCQNNTSGQHKFLVVQQIYIFLT